MGNERVLYRPNEDADELPPGMHSTKCIGKLLPDPKEDFVIEKDIVVPTGKVINSVDANTFMDHNEYIVYDTKQIKMKYICMVNFK